MINTPVKYDLISHFGNFPLDIYMGTLYMINVRVVSKKTLVDYYSVHKEIKSQLETWYFEVKNANWKSPVDIKEKYGTARGI